MNISTVPGERLRTRHNWLVLVQFCLGMAVVGGLGWFGLHLWPKPELPPGWQIIRPPKDVMSLAVYQDELWSGGPDGLYRIDLQSGQVIERVQQPLNFRGVTSLVVDHVSGVLWVGHRAGVSRLVGDEWRTWGSADGLPDSMVLALCLTREGDLWAGTPHGAARFIANGWEIFDRRQGLASEAISVIFQDRQGRLWLGDGFTQQGGLSLFVSPVTGSSAASAMHQNLAYPVVNAILEDQQGNLWFGVGFSNRGGLTRFDGQSWRSWGQVDGLAGAKTRSLFQDAQGAFWAGSEYDGIAFIANGSGFAESGKLPARVQILTPRQGLAGWEVKTLLQDESGAMWLGTENGLSRLDRQAWQALSR